MASDFDSRLSSIESKARLLTERYHAVDAQRRALAAQVKELTAELDASRKTIETLRGRVEYLQLASTILPTGDDLEHSRRFLSELVWEIDKCISQLSE